MAEQLIVDLYGCDPALLDDPERVQEAAHYAVRSVGSDIVEECMHRFEPIGISYIAVITTSHFSIHTWPEYGYAAVDFFSCCSSVPETAVRALGDAFGAAESRVQRVERDLKGGIRH
ncbi:MAG: adenosylmethionine decarboxylase [Oscillospiraceae bacterium]|nr:adenosylmethionine decarboxylase [Oscillospiraceae bacterium]